jgi:DNA (cytosine-5)-methyltransferase 1
MKQKEKLNAIDLFCGCGGLSKGLIDAGINIIAGIDIWDLAIESYKKNFNHMALCKDLHDFSPEKFDKLIDSSIDIIVGGPPCQGFSIAGRRDINDPRNSLFMEFYKYLKYFKPKIFMMENVIGLLSMKTIGGLKVIDIIMEKLNKNYNCHINKLHASDFEVPQNRKRVIIIGIRKDLNIFPFEIEPILKKSERICVGSVLENKEDVDKKFYLSNKAINGINKKKEIMKNKGYGFGAQYLSLDKPSYTITARYWKDGCDALVKYNDDEIRRLTILELKRIQTFPDNFILIGSKKNIIRQIGNAIPCRFAYYLGEYVKNIL